MKDNRKFEFDHFSRRLLSTLVFLLLAINVIINGSHYSIVGDAFGHFTDLPTAQSGVISKNIGSYVVLFKTSPSPVKAMDNTTLLRFSVMQNNQDTYNVFAALIIKEKNSGNTSTQFPYKFYEFGDIDFRYAFQNAVPHEVILQARISGDPQYQNNPLVASFDVPVMTAATIGNLVVIVVILVFIALPVGMIILILDFNRRMKRNSSSK